MIGREPIPVEQSKSKIVFARSGKRTPLPDFPHLSVAADIEVGHLVENPKWPKR